MKLELLILLITVLVLVNTYFEGKLLSKLKKYEKYYKMVFFAFVGLCIYLYIKKDPNNYKDFVTNSNGYIKYLPIDRNTASIITPIIDFTSSSISKELNNNYNVYNYPNNRKSVTFSNQNQNQNHNHNLSKQQQKILYSGNTSTKRSVSETKKKYVASSQNWHCKHCKKQLPAWFEVDHVVRLEYGGGNGVENLVALCTECHGRKTAMENM
jgi:5-methylcytosine-specific restriction endonuclease McrA